MAELSQWYAGEMYLPQPKMAYALADDTLLITEHNEALSFWLELTSEEIVGQPLIELFPELIGIEEILTQIATGQSVPLTIPRTYRYLNTNGEHYFDLQLEPFASEHGRLLISMTNVTQQAFQEQRLRQQRNDLLLMSEQLRQANDQLAYLLKRFVPSQVAQMLIDSQNMPKPGGDQHVQATILFADMRNFTHMAEAFSPVQTLDILNLYLEVVTEAVWRYEGNLVQIVGDMVMVAFNVPQEQPDHAWRAIQAAVEMRHDLQAFRQSKPAHIPDLQFGIGLHTGLVTSGYLGVKNRYRYAVVGDATNVAYHLCARASGDQIIISEATLDLIETALDFQPLGAVGVKSRREQISIYEIPSNLSDKLNH